VQRRVAGKRQELGLHAIFAIERHGGESDAQEQIELPGEGAILVHVIGLVDLPAG